MLEQAEVFPVDIKLDYKPRRVDYRALRDGRTIELMNFFHFDGAEMTLRHITVRTLTAFNLVIRSFICIAEASIFNKPAHEQYIDGYDRRSWSWKVMQVYYFFTQLSSSADKILNVSPFPLVVVSF